AGSSPCTATTPAPPRSVSSKFSRRSRNHACAQSRTPSRSKPPDQRERARRPARASPRRAKSLPHSAPGVPWTHHTRMHEAFSRGAEDDDNEVTTFVLGIRPASDEEIPEASELVTLLWIADGGRRVRRARHRRRHVASHHGRPHLVALPPHARRRHQRERAG